MCNVESGANDGSGNGAELQDHDACASWNSVTVSNCGDLRAADYPKRERYAIGNS